MEKLNKIERVTKIVLSVAVVGTACKIALEKHESHKKYRKKVADILNSIGPHPLNSDKGQLFRFCMELLKTP